MLLTLIDDHKKHLSLLIAQTPQVLQDFCKLALDFLRKGANMKLYHTAANKLGVQLEAIRNVVEGLVNLFVESSKHELTAADFKDTLVTLGFTDQHQEVLCSFYEGVKSEIRDVLSNMTVSLPHYKNLEWRFEAQVASRSLMQQVTPLITMNLTLTEAGKGDSNICLQTDPNNLLHITQVLEEALHEAKSQHTRRVLRSFK
ncbi:COMM domain-containing protein 2 isoform X1 [Schistocerca nitens]|uniref:COMM domain-containing protein 2 isoform X1 n=2 Tax=Schistocerca nitens TaxID=7011 RepID=UPI0021186B46|nr:COMM domain-containing protein 2 isoform X1 [Schistocerca nitens]